jgi:hypothetical protein
MEPSPRLSHRARLAAHLQVDGDDLHLVRTSTPSICSERGYVQPTCDHATKTRPHPPVWLAKLQFDAIFLFRTTTTMNKKDIDKPTVSSFTTDKDSPRKA